MVGRQVTVKYIVGLPHRQLDSSYQASQWMKMSC
ncbi:hypothetical protein CBM2599_B50403 [Cupriavidus taiwanensis]|nr:hypothetical protein CBM2599_B50403 [Cupriavidus taiwanensis]